MRPLSSLGDSSSSSSWQCKCMETDTRIHRLLGSDERIQAHVVVKSCSTEVSDGWVLL